MMILHILLTILKWIGILFLAVLGLLLLAVAAVLFVPVRYRAKGSKHERTQIYVCVSWLLHVLHATIQYQDGKPIVQLRIFGILVRRGRKKKKSAKGARDLSAPKAKTVGNADAEDVQDDSAVKLEDASGAQNTQDETDTRTITFPESTEDAQERNGFFQRLKDSLVRIRNVLRGIRDAFFAAKDRAAYVCDQIRRMWSWWQQPDTGRAAAHVKEELRYVLQKVKPRKCEILLLLGTGDPASTGELLGALGIVYAWTNGCFTVTPDFEEKRLETEFRMKGRIFAYQLLGAAIRLWQDQDLRSCVAAFQNE